MRLERRDCENCEYSLIMMGLGTRSRKGYEGGWVCTSKAESSCTCDVCITNHCRTCDTLVWFLLVCCSLYLPLHIYLCTLHAACNTSGCGVW